MNDIIIDISLGLGILIGWFIICFSLSLIVLVLAA
jgi:hypothetical protein